MKGVIFTTFLESVEETWGADMVDTIIDKSDLESGGSYTAVGTYAHTEAVNLIVSLGQETNTPVDELLKGFGAHLFEILIKGHPHFAIGIDHPLDFLEGVERYIHVEVKKLYPDAELPTFDCQRISDSELMMIYSSNRHLEDLCEGLIRGCIKHFGRECQITRQPVAEEKEQFLIKLSD